MPRQKEFDREEVLQKAMIVFRDKGYAATSMQDLVDGMRINRFSLYETFKSKHDLFVDSLHAYYENVAIPYFDRLKDSQKGLEMIEQILTDLVARIKTGISSNGCLLCNTIAEYGAKQDKRVNMVLDMYLKRLENNYYSALLRAKELGEISRNVNAGEYAKVLVGYTVGLLSVAKILSEKEMRKSVKATIAAVQ